jgi:hypothetical protein
MWEDARTDVAFAFALFSFVYILILSAAPPEIHDCDGNIVYMKTFCYALTFTVGILVLFGIIRILSAG